MSDSITGAFSCHDHGLIRSKSGLIDSNAFNAQEFRSLSSAATKASRCQAFTNGVNELPASNVAEVATRISANKIALDQPLASKADARPIRITIESAGIVIHCDAIHRKPLIRFSRGQSVNGNRASSRSSFETERGVFSAAARRPFASRLAPRHRCVPSSPAGRRGRCSRRKTSTFLSASVAVVGCA